MQGNLEISLQLHPTENMPATTSVNNPQILPKMKEMYELQ